jgi:hypothetical protein
MFFFVDKDKYNSVCSAQAISRLPEWRFSYWLLIRVSNKYAMGENPIIEITT